MKSRSNKAIINIIIIFLMQIMSFIYSLISKKLFLEGFSISVYGVIDLFSSFFNSLMLLELGFGTILIYNLYKPFAENDLDSIRKQLSYFKTIYLIISIIVLIISVVVGFFVYDIFHIDCSDRFLVYEIYFLNILHVLVKYHFLHKVSILSATGEKYLENITYIFVEGFAFLFRIASIKIFNSEKLYVFSLLIIPVLMYFINSIWVDKKYNIKGIGYAKISEIIESGVLIQCKKYIYATIYTLTFVSMDNIIILMKLSTDSIAYITNYVVLFNIGKDFIVTIMYSLRGIMADYYNSVKSDDSFYEIYDIVSGLNFFITALVACGFYCLIDNFIALWIGERFYIENSIVIVLLINVVIDTLFGALENVFVIKGYIFQEKWPLILSALTNVVLTIVFIDAFGLIGAYVGTFFALLIKWISKFKYVISDVFSKYKKVILSRNIFNILLIAAEMFIISDISKAMFSNVNTIVLFVCKTIFVVMLLIIFNGIYLLLNENVRKYIKNTILNYCKK